MRSKLSILLLACIILVPPSQCTGQAATGQPATSPEVASHQAKRQVEQGDLYFSQGVYSKAIEEYTAAIGLDPRLAAAYGSRGRAYYFTTGATAKTDEDLLKAIALDPKYASAYYYLGLSDTATGAYDRAIADFSKAIELDKGLARAYSFRGWCYAIKSQWDQPSQLYLYQLWESDSGITKAYEGIGWVYVRQMQWELFVAPDLVRAAEPTPVVAEAYMNRGFAYFKKAQWARAIADLDKVYALDPRLNRGDWNKDWAVSKQAQWDRVITDYQKVIEIVSGQAMPSPGSGTLKEALAQAIADYSKAAELSKDPALSQRIKDALKFIDEWSKVVAK